MFCSTNTNFCLYMLSAIGTKYIMPYSTQQVLLPLNYKFLIIVSHTTDDMIFEWDPDVPLVVDEHIELPQLALVKNFTADCTQVYSTGNYVIKEKVIINVLLI